MDKLNETYINSFSSPGSSVDGEIDQGQHYRLSVGFQPMELFDISAFGGYQFGSSSGDLFVSQIGQLGSSTIFHEGTIELKTRAITVGLSSTFYVSHLLAFHSKEGVLQRLHLGVELAGGVGFSNAGLRVSYPTLSELSGYSVYESLEDLQGQLGIMMRYDLFRSPLLSSIGIRLGYQFFRTQTLQDKNGRDWNINNDPIHLDFSGFYGGIFVRIAQ